MGSCMYDLIRCYASIPFCFTRLLAEELVDSVDIRFRPFLYIRLGGKNFEAGSSGCQSSRSSTRDCKSSDYTASA